MRPPAPPQDRGLHTLLKRVQSDDIAVISTDVFDTLLLRSLRSERQRMWRSEVAFSRTLAKCGFPVTPDALLDARLIAQEKAFQALRPPFAYGEVRLNDVVRLQLKLLNLPAHFAAARIAIELDTELSSLILNTGLHRILHTAQALKKPVIAISDTMLSAADIEKLLQGFCGKAILSKVFTSADIGLTKRQGELFRHVAQQLNTPERHILHVGDDLNADYGQAMAQGLHAHYVPRPRLYSRLRRMNGGACALRRHARLNKAPQHVTYANAEDFGHVVLGPIVAQFCVAIWLYLDQATKDHDAALLFCARGGIGVRAAFERVVANLNLPTSAPRANLMISRLVAARAAILSRSKAAIDELAREFDDATMQDAIKAICDTVAIPGAFASRPFCVDAFFHYLFSPRGVALLNDIERQDALFHAHLQALAGGAQRIILCDTGLFGSTQRLLASTLRYPSIETIHFARANYKRMSEEHFNSVAGLIVEQTGYTPHCPQSAVLRYWHLIETLFEPAIASVRRFDMSSNGHVIANCGDIGSAHLEAANKSALLRGALAYIETLTPSSGEHVFCAAAQAWRRLRRAITRPQPVDLIALDAGARSRDFGRTDSVNINANPHLDFAARLRGIQTELWREGAVARHFPLMKHAILPTIDIIQSWRGLFALRRMSVR